MPRPTIARLRGSVAMLFLASIPVFLAAAPAADPKKNESSAEKIRKALDQTIDVDIAEQPLAIAINQLKELAKVNLVVDTATLCQNGIDPNSSPVTIKQTGVKARLALRAMLSPYHISYAIIGDSVLITTQDMALYRQLKQNVNLDVEKTAFETALKDLARETAVQILVDKKVNKEAQTQVSLQLEDVPLDTAVRLLCEQADLKVVRLGNILYVTSVAKAKELRAEPDLAPSVAPGFPGGQPVPAAFGVAPGLIDRLIADPAPPAAPSKDP
jgi:hypothetical protein